MTEIDIPGQGRDAVTALVLAWLATKRAVNTRRAYGRDIAGWLEWLAGRGTAPLDAGETDAALWARALEAQKLAAPTVARKLSAVAGWYTWLVRHGHVTVNPFAYLDRPRVDADVSMTPGLTRDQALALLEAADTAAGPQKLRTAALVSVFTLTGCRVDEALSATVADLGTDRGHQVLTVRRKGGKVAHLVVPAPAWHRVSVYLAARPDIEHLPALPGQVSAAGAQPLFATSSGAAMGGDDVRRMLAGLGKRAGLPPDLIRKLGPHVLRHAFATLALDAGVSLRDLQDAMGHADPRTTRRYDRARYSLDRSPGLALAGYLSVSDDTPPGSNGQEETEEDKETE